MAASPGTLGGMASQAVQTIRGAVAGTPGGGGNMSSRLFKALICAFSEAIPCHLVCPCGNEWVPEGRDRQCPKCEEIHDITDYFPKSGYLDKGVPGA